MNKLYTLNPRERTLLSITIFVCSIALIAGVFLKVYSSIKNLDTQILNAEQELVNLQTQYLHQNSIDKAYQKVLTSHTTAQSKEEIHDSLRREIYRLALRNPEAVASPTKLSTKNKYLIQIPELKEGLLSDEGDGYQEYQIHFRIPSCTLDVALEYLKRLETSHLILRIDSLEITRSHTTSNISMTIGITRTIISPLQSEEST